MIQIYQKVAETVVIRKHRNIHREEKLLPTKGVLDPDHMKGHQLHHVQNVRKIGERGTLTTITVK